MRRRTFLYGSAACVAARLPLYGRLPAPGSEPSGLFVPWRPGFLDLHHIATGRGNSMLAIAPDGTALLVDAGARIGNGEDLAPLMPDGSRRPGEWIARYARHHLRTTPKVALDTALITHLHEDHIGQFSADLPLAPNGSYRLTGISDVAQLLPLRRLIDRGFPEYNYPGPLTDPSAKNYIAFVRSAMTRGLKVEQLQVGSHQQIGIASNAYNGTPFVVTNLAANGVVWTGAGNATRSLFPSLKELAPASYPTENMCSAALRIRYGRFTYYNGGDLTCDTRFGTEPWRDAESAVARAAGPVSVASLNHHGYFDSTGPEFVRRMQARIYVLQSWHVSHPDLATLDRLYSPILAPGRHDVLATNLTHAAELVGARLTDRMLSQQGHVVVRVHPGGNSYEIAVLDNTQEEGRVKASFGPFEA